MKYLNATQHEAREALAEVSAEIERIDPMLHRLILKATNAGLEKHAEDIGKARTLLYDLFEGEEDFAEGIRDNP